MLDVYANFCQIDKLSCKMDVKVKLWRKNGANFVPLLASKYMFSERKLKLEWVSGESCYFGSPKIYNQA